MKTGDLRNVGDKSYEASGSILSTKPQQQFVFRSFWLPKNTVFKLFLSSFLKQFGGHHTHRAPNPPQSKSKLG